jgi:hypothetical protein
MSGLRPWQLIFWREQHGAPFVSVGIHIDLHTPTVDLHVPFWTVQLGRNLYWRKANAMPGMRFLFGDRLLVSDAERWTGHTDNCDHGR